MDHRFRWMAGLAVVLVAIAVGTVAYNAGVSHGLAISAPAVGAAPGAAPGAPAAAYYYARRPWGFGFFPLGILLFWFLFARLFFWGGCYRRRWYYPGPYDAPPSFDEWHRRAHERMNNPPRE
jgi:hypothetical protein